MYLRRELEELFVVPIRLSLTYVSRLQLGAPIDSAATGPKWRQAVIGHRVQRSAFATRFGKRVVRLERVDYRLKAEGEAGSNQEFFGHRLAMLEEKHSLSAPYFPAKDVRLAA